MRINFPVLNLKAKLIALIVALLALTLGAEMLVSLKAEEVIVKTTQKKVKDLASVIQISVRQVTSVAATDRDRLQNHAARLHTHGLEGAIASSQDLLPNTSKPTLDGAALNPEMRRAL